MIPILCPGLEESDTHDNHHYHLVQYLETLSPRCPQLQWEYPAIDGSKKPCVTNTALTNNSINVDTAGNTLMTINLDELQSAYESKCNELKVQISKQHNKMEQMHAQLQKNFEQQIQQLKLKMESNTKQMVYDFGQWFQMVMQKIEELVVDRTKMQAMMKRKCKSFYRLFKLTRLVIPLPWLVIHPNVLTRLCVTPSHDPHTEPMYIDQADGSLPTNPTASHANHNNDGSIASASTTKWVTYTLSLRPFFICLLVTLHPPHILHTTLINIPSQQLTTTPHCMHHIPIHQLPWITMTIQSHHLHS